MAHMPSAHRTMRDPHEMAGYVLCQDLLKDMLWFHAGQTLLQALETVGKAFVVNAKAVQQSSVQIIHMTRLVNDVVTEVIRLPIDHATFNAATSHPHAKAARMMIATIIRGC